MITDWERCETGDFPSRFLSQFSLCPNHAHAIRLWFHHGANGLPFVSIQFFTKNSESINCIYFTKVLPLFCKCYYRKSHRRRVLESDKSAQSNIPWCQKAVFNWEIYRAEESCLQQITNRRTREISVGEEKLFWFVDTSLVIWCVCLSLAIL